MLPFLVILVLFLLAPIIQAEVILVPNAVAVAAGAVVPIKLLVVNGGPGPMTWKAARSIAARLHSGSTRSEDIKLTSDEPEAECVIPPGGCLRFPYQLQLPPGLFGPIVIELTQIESRPVMFSIVHAEDADHAGSTPLAGTAKAPADAAHETALRRSTRLLSGISGYEPIYFGLGGNGGLNAKFQFSLKYHPTDLVPLFLSYSQTSIWDLHASSEPFHDTSYRPRLFFLHEQLWVAATGKAWFGLESGYGHESNGQSGRQSRAVDILYVRPRFDWTAPGGYHFFISPMIYDYLDKSENLDIAAYRGYVDLLLGVNKNGWRLNAIVRKGTQGNFGSVEVNAVLPLRSTDQFFERLGARGINGYWFVQYFDGWGETILDYNFKFTAQFRSGLMLVP